VSIRDIFVAFGFDIDNAALEKANATVEKLKNAATEALSQIGVKFATDDNTVNDVNERIKEISDIAEDSLRGMPVSLDESTVDTTIDSIENIAETAGTVKDNPVGFNVDENGKGLVFDSVEELKAAAAVLEENDVNFQLNERDKSLVFDSVSDMKGAADVLEKLPVGYEVNKKSERTAIDSIKNIRAMATKFLGVIGIGFSLLKMKDLSEEFNSVNTKINDATRGMGDQADIQQRIMRTANETRMSYADMAGSVSSLVANRNVFDNVEDAANFAGLMAKEFTATGKSQSEVNSLMETITKSMARGTVDARAMNSIMQNSPNTFNMIADSLGVSTTRLQEMAQKGEISAETLRNVFEANAEGIEQRFGETSMSISDAFLNVRNQLGLFISETDDLLKISQTVAKAIVMGFNRIFSVLRTVRDGFINFADRVGGLDKIFKLLTIVAGAFMAVLAVQKIMGIVSALKAMDKTLLKAKLKMFAVVAVLVIIALLVEDFINFMKGNDSVIGEVFEKFGIDGDAVRETVLELMEAAKDLIPVILEIAKAVGGMLLGAVKEILPLLLDLVMEIVPLLIDLIMMLIPFVIEIISAILPVIIQLITTLIPLIVDIIKQILPVVINLIKTLLPLVMQIIQAVLPIIIRLIEKLLPLIMSIIQRILPVIIRLIETLIPVIMTIIEAVLPILIGLIEMLIPIIMMIIDAILPIVISLIELLISIIMPILDLILPLLMTLLEALMPVIIFVAELLGNVLGAAFEGLMPIIEAVMGIFQGLIDFITAIFTGDWTAAWEAVVSIFRNIIDGIAAIFKLPINLIITGINTFLGGLNKLKIPDWVPGVGGKGINIPLIPMLAKGSDNSPDTFIAGEQGPELITNAHGSKVFTAGETVDIFNKIKEIAGLFTMKPPPEGGDPNEIQQMLGNIANALKDLAKLGEPPRPETLETVSNYVENTTINQNIEITNEFNGDRAGQEKSSEAMDKATDDITGTLARAMAY
jgi:tape measure domain-containing protein